MGSSTVCVDNNNNNQHKLFYPSHHLYFINKKTLREIDIPPRKLLSRRAAAGHLDSDHMFMMDSSKGGGGCCGVSDHEAALLQKFLSYDEDGDGDGDGGDVDAADPYSSDHFRMYEFKVRKCTRSRSHDWTDCPFAHPGEKARRRDPRRYHYTGTICSEFRRGSCSRGDNCEFAHGVFECWLHPSRYRTEACKDGKNCKRKVCFFAHTPRQLRVLPPSYSNTNNNSHEMNVNATTSLSSSPMSLEKNNNNNKHRNVVNHCCMYCHSPTSTLIGMSHLSPPMSPSSHTLSPPLSPVKSVGGFSRYKLDNNHHHNNNNIGLIPQFGNNSSSSSSNSTMTSYKDKLNELMSSLEAMQVSESPSGITSENLRWFDLNFNGGDDQQQFILSPSTPTPASNKFFNFHGNISNKNLFEENGLSGGPDLGWVNDLLT